MRPGGPLTSRMKFFAVWIVVGFAPLMVLGRAQENGLGSSGSSAMECPASNSDNIAVRVEVTDKSGHAVTGLEAADFKVFDNNHPVKVLGFRAVDATHPSAVPVEVQIVIDAVNSDAVLVARERDGVSAFLKESSGKLAYSTSIWMLENPGLTRIAGPSEDGGALLTALGSAPSLLRVINRSAGTWGDVERAGQGIKLLKEMVAPESRTPGQKLVLIVSPGWPLLFNYEPDQRKVVFEEIVSISNGLRESCISLYTLDPAGFRGNASSYDSFLKGVTKIGDAQYPNLSMQVLSLHSGGQVIIGNDTKAELDEVLHGASAWYDLTFERASAARGSEYHAIRVTVNQARMKIHTTAGYYAGSP